MDLPILYKKASDGKLQLWGIDVDDEAGILISFGQIGGVLQHSREVITKGKNLGRANATTPQEQAECEALARHTKQRKKGYVESVEAATSGAVDEVIEGGILPMLAPNKSYPKDDDLGKAIKFPAFFQPKLDGMRCIAIVEDGKCTLWSRTRKPIRSVPHIVAAYEAAFPVGYVTLDGELYNHDFRAEFEELISILRGSEPDAEGRYLKAEHHVYDCLYAGAMCKMEEPFSLRNETVEVLLSRLPSESPIKRVKTISVASWVDLIAAYEAALVEEYEGGMARNADAPYESGKRSRHLQKMKEFETKEFEIIGADEGRGKDAGTVGAFVCKTAEGKEFRVRMRATYARRRELFANPAQWEGKQLTVKFKRWTAYGIPYIPIGLGLRDYE